MIEELGVPNGFAVTFVGWGLPSPSDSPPKGVAEESDGVFCPVESESFSRYSLIHIHHVRLHMHTHRN